MHKITLAILVSVSMLMGCASGMQLMPAAPKRSPPPASSTTPCQDELPQPASAKGTDLLANHVEAAKLYHDCRLRHQDLAGWAKNGEAAK